MSRPDPYFQLTKIGRNEIFVLTQQLDFLYD
jgi:hypothetical protein